MLSIFRQIEDVSWRRGHGLFSRPAAGTRSHRVKLWQLKFKFEMRRTLSGRGVICGTHGLG